MNTRMKNNGTPVRNCKAAKNMGQKPNLFRNTSETVRNRAKISNGGTVLLMTVFIIALLGALVMGIAQLNTEEVQIVRNQIHAAEAMAVAEAGLNNVFAEIREDSGWVDGFIDEPFNGGEYDVYIDGDLPNLTIVSEGTSSQNFVARVAADITVGGTYPYIIRIDSLRINEEE